MNKLQKNNKYIFLNKDVRIKKNEMSRKANKLLYFAISKINLSNPEKTRKIRISRNEIIEILKLNTEEKYKTEYIKEISRDMIKHAKFTLKEKPKTLYPIFKKWEYRENNLKIEFSDFTMTTFKNLQKNKNYITIYLKDMLEMTSTKIDQRAEELYLHFLVNSARNLQENTIVLSDEELKNIFAINKYTYLNENLELNRIRFEQEILKPILKKLTETKHVTLIPFTTQKGLKLYEKVKENKKTTGYKLQYKINKI